LKRFGGPLIQALSGRLRNDQGLAMDLGRSPQQQFAGRRLLRFQLTEDRPDNVR
jgi:hypothetical protein